MAVYGGKGNVPLELPKHRNDRWFFDDLVRRTAHAKDQEEREKETDSRKATFTPSPVPLVQAEES